VITQSVPQMYLSALQFSPRKSNVANHYHAHFKNTLSVEAGRVEGWPGTLNVLVGHSLGVQSVAFSHDGRHIVSGSYDMTIRVWDAATGDAVAGPLKGHTGYVYSVAISPDGKYIASGSANTTIWIWDAVTEDVVAGPCVGHLHSVFCVAFSPNSKHIASGSTDNTIRVWDAKTGEIVAGPFNGCTSYVYSVAFSPDGRHIVSRLRGQVHQDLGFSYRRYCGRSI
jgi:WD40 repeat protein